MLKIENKLSRKISLGITLMAVVIFVLSLGLLYRGSRDLIHKEVTRCIQTTLNTAQQRIRNCMTSVEKATDANAWLIEDNFTPESLLAISRRIVLNNPNVNDCSISAEPDVFPQQGHCFSVYTMNDGDSVISVLEPDYDYFSKAWYRTPLLAGRACWIDPFDEHGEGTLSPSGAIASYCRPLRLKGGRLAGVISTDLSFSKLAETVNAVGRPYDGAYFMLLGGDGRYLVHPDSTQLFRKTIFTDVDPSQDKDMIALGHEMMSGREGTMHVNYAGVNYHVCYQPVTGTNWSLALVVPDLTAMNSYYRLGYVIAALLIIGLIVVLLLSHHVVKQMTSPINRLIDATKHIADGQYDETIPQSNEESIIGSLQNSFSKMQQSLSERMGSLRKHVAETRAENEKLAQVKAHTEDFVLRKNQFIQYATQQMRMPLNVITGFTDVLAGGASSMVSEAELDSIKDMMKHNVASMNRMTLMMLDATDTDSAENLVCARTDEVMGNRFAQDCISHTLIHFPEANIQFETELHDGTQILTNRTYLASILRELLNNAAQFSDGKHILLRLTQTETTFCFTIQDVGPGISASIPDIDPLAKTDNLSEATGVGLPLAMRHAIALGGNLTVAPHYHEGCRVMIEIPR